VTSKRSCFVIAPIGRAGSDVRKRSDQLIKHVLEPVLGDRYEIRRADQLGKPGIITSQVIEHVVNDDLVAADLTSRNPNVFYELAVRHALRKPLIQLIAAGEELPFDVAGMRTIFIDIHDLDNVNEAKREIEEQVHAMDEDATPIDTPIDVALNAEQLRGSGDVVQKSLGELLQAVTELRNELRADRSQRTAAFYGAGTFGEGTFLGGTFGRSTYGRTTLPYPPAGVTLEEALMGLTDDERRNITFGALLDRAAEVSAKREARLEKLRHDAELDLAHEALEEQHARELEEEEEAEQEEEEEQARELEEEERAALELEDEERDQ
jgi:hypothetical protein